MLSAVGDSMSDLHGPVLDRDRSAIVADEVQGLMARPPRLPEIAVPLLTHPFLHLLSIARAVVPPSGTPR